MAPPRGKSTQKSLKDQPNNIFDTIYRTYCNVEFVKSLIFDPSKLPIVSYLILAAELILNVLIVHRVNYTEIDWKAYMQECEGFLNGTTDYSQLKGDTGPLVYPAGFVYIYSILYFVTSRGVNIRLGQYIFIGIYLAQMFLVLRLYSKTRKVPPFVLILTTFTSYRIHSIYVLRLFNDPVAILFLYLALNLFLDQRWSWGSFFFSVAVSVKMNILLFAPALLLLYITNVGYVQTIKQLSICGATQIILGAPFLLTFPLEYLKGSFDLGRIFEHKWTVNYRFLDRELFEDKIFHLVLLALHLILLLIFAKPTFKYFQSYARIRALQTQLQPQIDAKNKEVSAQKSKNKNLPKFLRQRKLETTEAQEVVSTEESFTPEQGAFLKSFEKSLQKSSGTSAPTPKPVASPSESEQYSIHFEQATLLVILPLFFSNFIGILCARSLHYQFYIWYFHTLPYLTWYTEYKTSIKFLFLVLIELCWNTYPSTVISSLLLHSCHLVLLYGIAKKFLKS